MSWTHTRAILASTRRHHPDVDTTDLRRKLRAERLADTITRSLAQTPPLTVDERCALAALLLAGTHERAAA